MQMMIYFALCIYEAAEVIIPLQSCSVAMALSLGQSPLCDDRY